MDKHSETPWSVGANQFGSPQSLRAIWNETGRIADDLYPKDAEFICLAVNNHDALVAALKDAIAECCEHNGEYHHYTTPAKLAHWMELVKSASPGRDKVEG